MSATETIPPTALLPGSLHRPVYLAMASCAGVFLWLAIRVAGGSQAGQVDRWIAKAVSTRLPLVIVEIIPLGDAVPVIIAALLLLSLSIGLGSHRFAVLTIAGPCVTGLVTTGVKPLVGRTIRDHLAYPSGHTGAWTALGLVTALVLIGLLRTGVATRVMILATGAVLPGAAMALALQRISSHYPSDTVGGFCAAVVCVLGRALVIDRVAGLAGRRHAHTEQRVLNDGD